MITREEAKQKLCMNLLCSEASGVSWVADDFVIELIDQVFNDFEQLLSNLNSNIEDQEIMIADYKKRIEELEDAIYAKSKQVDELKAQRMELWMLLDNIDTSEDIAKDSDKLFRNLCRNEYPKRLDIYEPNDIEG